MNDSDISNNSFVEELPRSINQSKLSLISVKDKIITGILLILTIILFLISLTPWIDLSNHNILVLFPPLIIVFTITSMLVIFLSSIYSYKKFKLLVIPLLILTLFNGNLILNSPNNNDKIESSNELNIFTLNAEYGNASATDIMKTIKKTNSDVIVFVEMTQNKLDELSKLGLNKIVPYKSSNFNEGSGAQGSIVLSKYSLKNVPINNSSDLYFQTPAVVVNAPHGDVLVRAIHIFPPVGSNVIKWNREMKEINTWYENNHSKYKRIILAGDYNATNSYKNFRNSFRGMIDAYPTVHYHRPTWPADKLFPFADLDHVLTKGFYINKSNIIQILGTDHEGITTELKY